MKRTKVSENSVVVAGKTNVIKTEANQPVIELSLAEKKAKILADLAALETLEALEANKSKKEALEAIATAKQAVAKAKEALEAVKKENQAFLPDEKKESFVFLPSGNITEGKNALGHRFFQSKTDLRVTQACIIGHALYHAAPDGVSELSIAKAIDKNADSVRLIQLQRRVSAMITDISKTGGRDAINKCIIHTGPKGKYLTIERR